jgi:RHS repeat-associated protein
VVYTGAFNFTPASTSEDNLGRLELQDEVDDPTRPNIVWHEERIQPSETINGTSIFYTHASFPKNNLDLLTINYYDNYPNLNVPEIELAPNTTIYDEVITSNVKTLPTYSQVRVLGTDDWITSVTYYDEDARPIYSASKNDYLVTVDKVKSDLDFAGKVLQTESTHKKDANPVITITDVYTYDHVGRLQTQVQTIAGNDPELIVNNHYDELGQLVAKNVGGEFVGDPEDATGLQTVDYKYNIRGWLKTINNGNTINNDLFSFQLDYNTGVNPLYNGNISETHWQTANDHNPRSYNYTYDALNRLKMANYNGNYIVEGTLTQEENYNLDAIGYDKNGNITVLERQGLIVAENRIDLIDDLTYDYQSSSNKLIRVTDDASVDGFKDGTTALPGDPDYQYDINGNLTVDTNKNITDIIYNHLNLPETILFSSPEGNINYKYSATGVKLEKAVMWVGSPGSVRSTQYAGGFVYNKLQSIGGMPNPNPPPPPVFELQFISHPEGYAQPNTLGTFDYIYQYKDHLGNVRLSYSDINNNGSIEAYSEILEEHNYYPFGLKQKGYNNVVNGTHIPYMHGGKELQEEFGANFYDFETRGYDPALGRFMQLDEMAIIQTSWTPYHYNANNPIKFKDPTGLLPTYDWDTGTYLDDDGNEISWQDALGAYGVDTGSSVNNGSDSVGCDDCSKCPETCNDSKKNKQENKEWDNSGITGALATSGILLADDASVIGVVDDVLIPFVIAGGITIYLYDNAELMAKQAKEIKRILEKTLGPTGFTYALTVNQVTTTVDVRGNIVHLKPGDVWKYGETSKGFSRYSDNTLKNMVPGGVTMLPLFFGNVIEIKVQEKIMIYGHVLMKGSLPPGNKIFR